MRTHITIREYKTIKKLCNKKLTLAQMRERTGRSFVTLMRVKKADSYAGFKDLVKQANLPKVKTNGEARPTEIQDIANALRYLADKLDGLQ